MKISSRVKLPLKICSGSVNERNRYAENMLSNFVNKIEPELNKRDELSLQRIQAIIKETIPYRKIYVETVESNNNAGNNFLIHCNENGKLDALAVELETNKNGKIAKDQCNALYHETWHVFEHISNPKYLARTMSFNDYLTEKYLNFYHRYFYTDNKYNPKILTKKL
ncbi:hypothetical protein IJZ97_00090, partial [bacterium]|nr:hypothetical protein [bacterium]